MLFYALTAARPEGGVYVSISEKTCLVVFIA